MSRTQSTRRPLPLNCTSFRTRKYFPSRRFECDTQLLLRRIQFPSLTDITAAFHSLALPYEHRRDNLRHPDTPVPQISSMPPHSYIKKHSRELLIRLYEYRKILRNETRSSPSRIIILLHLHCHQNSARRAARSKYTPILRLGISDPITKDR